MQHHIAQGYTTIATLNQNIFFECLKSNVGICYKILNIVCQRHHILLSQLYLSTTATLRQLLAIELIFFADYHSLQLNSNIIQLKLKLTQENFAELLNTSRQSINKEFNWLTQNAIIDVKNNYIHIINYEKLRELSLPLQASMLPKSF
ncbi:Crp/Fnr family transcriptional regulator [Acinetobacter puyangensis]|uniref:Crp/Fnr family transcriptional regulator n=1 Tax=Acinetobacter puyangensis TaxID=1096779 RepID=UPI003A4E5A00